MRISDWSSDVCSSDLRMNARDWEGILRLLDGGFQASWPQTGERIPSPADYVGLNRTYPGVWRCTVLAVDATAEGAVARVRVRSEEHTSELQSLMRISYAVFCLKKKNKSVHVRR